MIAPDASPIDTVDPVTYYLFDLYGWYAGTIDQKSIRATEVEPKNKSTTLIEGEMRANFTGYEWIDTPYKPAPTPEPEPVKERHISPLAFRNRFTLAEKVGIEMAALDNPSAGLQQRQMAAALRAAQLDVSTAKFIDLNKPDTRERVQGLEVNKIIAAGRALEILDADAQPDELP